MCYTEIQKNNSPERNGKVNISEKNKKRIRIGYGILISLMLLLVAALFISSCYSIYKSGQSPFTRESISVAFSGIAVWVYITISLVIVGAGLAILLPEKEKKLKGERSLSVLVRKFADRVDIDKLDSGLKESINKERKARSIMRYVRIALIFLSATLPLIFLLNPANFPAVSGEYNAEILHGMLLYLAFLSPMIVYEVVYTVLCDLSLGREYEHLKKAIAENGISEITPEPATSAVGKAIAFVKGNEKPITLGVRIAFVGCAIVFIIIGIYNGGMADVLNKAIKICTECIGLG